MVTVNQIREHLLDILNVSEDHFEDALDQFEEWFSGASWNMHQSSDLIAQRFAGKIELLLANCEMKSNSLQCVRSGLKSLYEEYSLLISYNSPVTAHPTSSINFSSQVWSLSAAGKTLVTAS